MYPPKKCFDGDGDSDHEAEGWLCSEGLKIVAKCRAHAEASIKHYQDRLKDDSWTFEVEEPVVGNT